MYSGDREHTATRAVFSTDYQPCIAARSLHHSTQPGQVPGVGSAAVQPRCAKKRHAARPSTSRRSSTTVVTTDVSNFRAMVQELTSFPPAAIFRPLPRRVHAANPLAAVHGCGGGSSCSGGALYGHSSDTATTAGNSSPDVPTVQPLMHPPQCAPPGVFYGLSDLGSPEFDSWVDLSFEFD